MSGPEPQRGGPGAPVPEGGAPGGAIARLLDREISPEDLASGAREAAAVVARASRASFGALLFRIGNETLALPASALIRITTWRRPTPIPHRTGGILRGLCNIRGELALCADLGRLLGLPEKGEAAEAPGASDPRRMIMLGAPSAPWVFEADALAGVERVDRDALLPAPVTVGKARGSFVTGLAVIGGPQVVVLDAERVVAGFEAGIA